MNNIDNVFFEAFMGKLIHNIEYVLFEMIFSSAKIIVLFEKITLKEFYIFFYLTTYN